jgi:hypothetical protein
VERGSEGVRLYWAMTSIRAVVFTLLLVPTAGFSQVVKPPRPPRPTTPLPPPYRGFTPGISYRAFVERARALADGDVLRCQTSRRTAQLMECGVVIRDPTDGARFYVSAHFTEGNAVMVALFDSAGFGDKRGVALLDRTKRDVVRVFGRPRPIGKSGWQWSYGRKVVRLNWRGRGTARWVSLTLTDNDVMDRVRRYANVGGKR